MWTTRRWSTPAASTRGKVTEAEAKVVRDNLAAINERLRREGERLIDPTNEAHAARYGF